MYSQNCTQGYVTTKPMNTVQYGGLIKTRRVAFTAHNIEEHVYIVCNITEYSQLGGCKLFMATITAHGLPAAQDCMRTF